ncbi:high-affinity choline transporter 1-like [Gigantopelta aegis]|uniref:high-affinity choline transporter 1-like n=1 Tax=Gigantopelta aegis TaxID=1735272 RepID=UPI001B8898E3|nr:high-affinity choline transporter 1-like [Gigantopelta aegis]XP_041364929.1 high-affinity choline transporter 1-like [Gigantopelta aegis]XP_041364930.1 high-affinity choline transporter 1-like [Gigantopelta aegis]
MGIFIGGLVAVIVFYILILVIGIVAARRSGHFFTNIDSKEVMLAGRKIGLFVGCFTMTATWVGGGFINGSAEAVVKDGLVWCQAPLGYGIALMFGKFLTN